MPFFKRTHEYGEDAALPLAEVAERLESDEERDARRRADVRDSQVVRLREAGQSWTQIAKATGLSRSGARQRWLAINGIPRARAKD